MSDDDPPQFDTEEARRPGADAARPARGRRRRRRSPRRSGSTPLRPAAPVRRHGCRTLAGTVSFGSNESDPVPKKAYASVFNAFTKKSGVKVDVNTVDHNTFQEQINAYLQGRPQDVFTWFAGYRMQFFAQKGLLTPIDDVWQTLGRKFSPAMRAASKGLDGNYYFVPIYNYPWAVFYRKSVFKQHGYKIPKTLGLSSSRSRRR